MAKKRIWQICLLCVPTCLLFVITSFRGNKEELILVNQTHEPVLNLHYGGMVYNSTNKHIVVFIHIQKTGGSAFLGHLTSAVTMEGVPMCSLPSASLKAKLNRKKDFVICPLGVKADMNFNNLPEMWLASERTYGWICGAHPFLSEMESCLNRYLTVNYGENDRLYHFITMLRHPVTRYVSEFLHVSRGAKWFNKHNCKGQTMDKYIPPCYIGYYDGYSWENVTFDKFIHCPYNWANNRQTIMITNLSDVDCLDVRTVRNTRTDDVLLENAKANLKKMAFFGLSEYFIESCILFEKQFNLKFDIPCRQKKTEKLHSTTLLRSIWSNRTLHNTIVRTNHLDMQLYDFALRLFTTRLKKYKISIN